jgi:hypothetical protein
VAGACCCLACDTRCSVRRCLHLSATAHSSSGAEPHAALLPCFPAALLPCLNVADWTVCLCCLRTHPCTAAPPPPPPAGFTTKPDVSWDDVGSLTEVREELSFSISQPIAHPERFEAMGLRAATGG